jgi:hypothetical protein
MKEHAATKNHGLSSQRVTGGLKEGHVTKSLQVALRKKNGRTFVMHRDMYGLYLAFRS